MGRRRAGLYDWYKAQTKPQHIPYVGCEYPSESLEEVRRKLACINRQIEEMRKERAARKKAQSHAVEDPTACKPFRLHLDSMSHIPRKEDTTDAFGDLMPNGAPVLRLRRHSQSSNTSLKEEDDIPLEPTESEGNAELDSRTDTEPELVMVNEDCAVPPEKGPDCSDARWKTESNPYELWEDEMEEQFKRCMEPLIITTVEADWNPVTIEPITVTALKEPPEAVHPYRTLRVGSTYVVRMGDIVSPHSFRLEFIGDSPNDEHAALDESLQGFYNDPVQRKKYEMRSTRPYVARLYAVKNEGTGKWERVRVQKLNFMERTVLVAYQDRVFAERGVSMDSLYELHPKFANWHRYPLHAWLKNTEPIDGAQFWAQEAIDFFRDCVQGKTFRAYITNMRFDKREWYHTFVHDRFTRAGVMLFEVHGDWVPINAKMILHRHARPSKSLLQWDKFLLDFHGLDSNNSNATKEENGEKQQA